MSRSKAVSDFDVVTGPPAPPVVSQRAADPSPAADPKPVKAMVLPDPGRLRK